MPSRKKTATPPAERLGRITLDIRSVDSGTHKSSGPAPEPHVWAVWMLNTFAGHTDPRGDDEPAVAKFRGDVRAYLDAAEAYRAACVKGGS